MVNAEHRFRSPVKGSTCAGLTRRRLLECCAIAFGSVVAYAAWAQAPTLPRGRPGDFRFTYRVRFVRPALNRLLVISAKEAYWTVGSVTEPRDADKRSIALNARDLDAFYASLRATGLARAKQITTRRRVKDRPAVSISIEWEGNLFSLSETSGQYPSDRVAWDNAIRLVDRLVKQKGIDFRR
jgi:hypothetical protein